MTYRRLIFAALGGWLTVSAYAQPASQSTEDSIRLFTDTVLSLVEGHSLYTDKLNWSTYRTAFTKEVLNESRFVDALPHFVALWRALDDTHSGIKHADQWYGIPASLDTNGMNDQLKHETDRWQKKVTRIQPDRLIKGGDNFDNLLNDRKVQTALMWLEE